jgi:hypothetical protein
MRIIFIVILVNKFDSPKESSGSTSDQIYFTTPFKNKFTEIKKAEPTFADPAFHNFSIQFYSIQKSYQE